MFANALRRSRVTRPEMAGALLNFVIRAAVLVAEIYAVVISLRYGGIFGWAVALIALLVGALDVVRLVGAAQALRSRVRRG